MNMSYQFGLESGQHGDILLMFSIALDSRVANMLILFEYVFSLGFESDHHVERL